MKMKTDISMSNIFSLGSFLNYNSMKESSKYCIKGIKFQYDC